MSTVMDRRIAHRRKAVDEAGARRRLRWLLVVLVLAGFAGTTGWLLYQSPYLAVSEISVSGRQVSRADEILAAQGVAVGVPTIRVDAASVEAALLEDPWIAAAAVTVAWPGSVTVEILEHRPAAWIVAGDAWLLVGSTGTVLEVATEPGDGPRILVGSERTAPGDAIDRAAGAALEFVQSLPGTLAVDAEVRGSDTALEATIAGHEVALGYPMYMAEKAAALVALLQSGVPEAADINVVSPERPAVKPQPDVETSEEVIGEPRPSG